MRCNPRTHAAKGASRQVLFGLFLAVSLAGATELPQAPPPAAGGYYPLQLLAGSRLMIAARINAQDVEALLDSAAEATIVDVGFARRIGVVSGERVVGHGSGQSSFDADIAHGVSLRAVGVELADQSVAIADLSDLGKRLLGRPIDAILGRELFDAARLEIDIEQQRIRVLPPGAAPRGTRLTLVAEHGIETIPVSVEGHPPVRATFDLGNGSHVLVARRYAEQLGLLKDRPVHRERGGGLGGETEREVFTLRSLQIAGRRFTDVTATIDAQDTASDVNVGISLLRHFTIVADYQARAVWLAPTQ
jgi:predicted aspartyl protease